jgi:lipid-A-disaccharide synthase
VKTIRKFVDRMLCILPFEEPFYADTGVSARFVGHPFAERPHPQHATTYRDALGLDRARTTVALVPGSRHGEISLILPEMLDAAERIRAKHPDAQFVMPIASTVREADLREHLARHATLEVKLVDGRAEEAVGASDAALIKSGTSTLEAALMARPMVVVYRFSWLSWIIARALVKVAHVALVNLLAGRRLVPELLQGEANGERMAAEIERLLGDRAARDEQIAGLLTVRASLGEPGAAKRVAEEIARYL